MDMQTKLAWQSLMTEASADGAGHPQGCEQPGCAVAGCAGRGRQGRRHAARPGASHFVSAVKWMDLMRMHKTEVLGLAAGPAGEQGLPGAVRPGVLSASTPCSGGQAEQVNPSAFA